MVFAINSSSNIICVKIKKQIHANGFKINKRGISKMILNINTMVAISNDNHSLVSEGLDE